MARVRRAKNKDEVKDAAVKDVAPSKKKAVAKKAAAGKKGKAKDPSPAKKTKKTPPKKKTPAKKKKEVKKPVTEEDLDKEMDEYMMKDPKTAEKKLEQDMDAYWAAKKEKEGKEEDAEGKAEE